MTRGVPLAPRDFAQVFKYRGSLAPWVRLRLRVGCSPAIAPHHRLHRHRRDGRAELLEKGLIVVAGEPFRIWTARLTAADISFRLAIAPLGFTKTESRA